MGATGRLILSGDAPPLPLKVVSRPAAVEAGTASAPVRLSFLGPHTLAVGTPVQVDIDAEEHTNVVLVPAQAIVREGEESAVFVAAGGKAQRRPVVVGIVAGDQAEIKKGLKVGEPVIVSGQAGLPDGAKITTKKPEDEKPDAAEPGGAKPAAEEPDK
jgi:multidrug efflux pump subunit AcrA (membrane-fusion protein)